MIERILKPFDFILQMPIEQQCEFSIGLSLTGFCFAAFLRESCKDHHIRYAARALGAAAFFAVSAFAIHATQKVEQLEQELFVQRGSHVQNIASQISTVAPESNREILTPGGTSVKYGRNGGRWERSVFTADGRTGRSSDSGGRGGATVDRERPGIDVLPNAEHVTF